MIENKLDTLSLLIPNDLYHGLEKIATKKGTTINAIVEKIVENHLNQNKPLSPGQTQSLLVSGALKRAI